MHWREERITEKESTTYKYHLEWTEKDIDSSDFKEKAGHENPHRSISLKSKTFHAVTHLGAYKLSAQCLDKLKRWHVSELTAANTAGLSPLITQPGPGSSYTGLRDGTRPTRVEGQAQARGEAYWSSIMDETKDLPRKFAYVRRETAAAAVATDVSGAYGATGSLGTPGDVRVSYDLILEGDASVVGVLQEGTFRAYTERDAHTVSGLLEEQLIPGDDGKDGDAATGDGTGLFEQIFRLVMQSPSGSTALLLVEERAATADQLFADETAKFRTRLSILRLACYIALSLGIYLMLNPIAELLSFLPFVDGLLKSLFFIVALLVGLVLWGLAVAVAWCVYRPEILLALNAGLALAFYVSGAAADGEPFGALVPLATQESGNLDAGFMVGGRYLSDRALGEGLALVALAPLAVVVYNLVEEVRFVFNVRQLNLAAGVPPPPKLLGIF